MSRDADLGWAAGVIDGEGCISLYPIMTKTGKSWVLRVNVTNTDSRMLVRLQEIFGLGTIHGSSARPNPNHKPVFHWQACSKKAERVLRLVLPHLIVKREQAEMGLQSRGLMGKHGRNTENPNIEQLAWLKTQLSDLKRNPA